MTDWKQVEKDRKEQLIKTIPDVYNYESLLYVGGHAKHRRNLQMSDEFLKAGYFIDVVEAYLPNVVEMREKFSWVHHVYHSDILKFTPGHRYDVAMFWHGIEHIQKREMGFLIDKMMDMANELLIFACPWGTFHQGEEYGNPFEKHVSHWMPDELVKYGLNVNAIGEPHVVGSNIIAWMRL